MTLQELSQEMIDDFVGASHGATRRVEELLARYPTLVNSSASWQEMPIEAAAQTGNEQIAQLLLAAGAALDICTAAMLGMSDKVATMLQANPELVHATGAHDIPVLFYPTLHGHMDIVELLLANGADINAGEGSNTPLHGAVAFDQTAIVKYLIEHGAEVNPMNFDGETPLHIALDRKNNEIIELLRRHGGVE